jgi:hypothetical protein
LTGATLAARTWVRHRVQAYITRPGAVRQNPLHDTPTQMPTSL